MANRIGTFPTFANLAPPWSLPTLDSNFVSVNTAINDSSLGFVNGVLTDTGSANAYVVTLPYGTPSAYNPGMALAFTPANSNTGASTITVNPLGSASILTSNGGALPSGALQANTTAFIVLIGTAFRLLSASYNPLTSIQTITGPGTFPIACAGFNAVQIFSDMSGAGGTYTFSLSGLAHGVPVDFSLQTNGSAKHIMVTATDNVSASYFVVAIYGGFRPGSSYSLNLGVTFDEGANSIAYHGVTFPDPVTSVPVLNLMAASY